MKLIDIHAHLESSKFKDDLDEVVERARKAGVKWIIESGTDTERNKKALEIARKYDIVRASFGLYPVGNHNVDEALDWIEEHANNCVAIGEIGLDNNDSEQDIDKQKEVFRKVLGLAKKLGKPVVIHSRKAELEAIEILEEVEIEGVVMHCFCGKKSLIRRCVENGWFFSVPPIIMRLDHFKMLVEMVPLSQILTETDAPFLSPVVGERNESGNVVVTVGEIARIKGISSEEVSAKLFENAIGIFDL